ncbi:MAG: hypothetical protein II369_04410 [Clostridia bacterium]|nr:hypothetical protein [Clostridia bacterium]MBQ1963343.1 hypothetical protein [Clostridia bacterium]MBQ5661712.1 hypothetical protein [Clostridia bacterium]MBQ5772784.1 hypothetical protein [Clostridia bacterium]
MTLTEKAAYIKGLAEGLSLDETTKEGKILVALLDLVSEMSAEIADIQSDIEDIDSDLDYLNEYIEELDDDLQDVEDFLDDEGDEELFDEDEDEEDWCCDGNCDDCDGLACEDEEYFEIVCPSCGETVCFDDELDPEDLTCPACGEKFGCIVDEDDLKTISEEK